MFVIMKEVDGAPAYAAYVGIEPAPAEPSKSVAARLKIQRVPNSVRGEDRYYPHLKEQAERAALVANVAVDAPEPEPAPSPWQFVDKPEDGKKFISEVMCQAFVDIHPELHGCKFVELKA